MHHKLGHLQIKWGYNFYEDEVQFPSVKSTTNLTIINQMERKQILQITQEMGEPFRFTIEQYFNFDE